MSTTSPTTLPRRNRLLSSCAVATIATLTVHMPVRAQATIDANRGFQGDGVFVGGAGGITTGPQNTTVTVNAPRNIINWTPTDKDGTGAVNFLPNGHTGNFVNDGLRAGEDYIVLNRIISRDGQGIATNRLIELNGLVKSTLGTNAGGAPGGQVWFYSPGGILVGSTGIFDVGSLLLTANDPTGNAEDENAFLNVENNTFKFGPARSGSFVEVQGTISAGSRNSYVALIAPRVVQSGNVTVNGSAAYVAAEAATMTISGSLFDIEVTQGSGFSGSRSEDAALVHEGTTTIRNQEVGYGDTGFGDSPTARTAIMVAVPKNDAVTMLVQGNIAYQQATNVEQVNGRIILSGGNDVRLDPFSQTHDFQANAATGKADILISNAEGRSRFGADVDAQATGIAKATAIARNQTETGYGGEVTPLDDLSFGGRLDLEGLGGASLEALAGSRIDVAGRLDVDATGTNPASTARASLIARAGSDIDIGSSATIDADLSASGTSGDAVNLRTAEILAEGGRIDFAGQATVDAAASVASRGSSGINVEGGTAKVVATQGGQIRVASNLTVDASAFGADCCSGLGGDATGGTAMVESGAGSLIRSGGNLGVYANGAGGFGGEGGVGAGFGGVASILAPGGAIEIANTLFVEANGFGGISFDGDVGYGLGKGGDAILGISTVATNVGRISVDNIEMEATGSAGFFGGGEEALFLAAENGSGGGGDAEGGRVVATIDGVLAPFSVEGSTSMELRADAFGSRGANESDGPAHAGGDAIGGTISVEFRSGTTSLASLSASAEGIGADGGSHFGSGDGAAGGTGDAGAITIRATGGEVSIGDLSIDLTGSGGDGGNGGSGGNGGAGGLGRGGDLTLSASGTGILTVTAEQFDASGFGGQGGNGGSSSGGTGGDGGNGGEAFGGIILVTASEGGTVNIRPTAIEDGYGNILGYEAPEFRAEAEGGSGGDGGRGFGGEGAGGIGGNGGVGGAGTGGRIEIDVTGGTLDFRPDVSDPVLTILRLLASGDGGQGGDGGFGDEDGGIAGNGGNGGFAKGGNTRISVTDGSLSVGQLQLVSAGHGGGGGIGGEAEEGGDGGRGGHAHGGGVTFSLVGGTSFNQLSSGIELQAYGEAGQGGDGGTGASVGGVSGAGGNGIGGGGTTEETGTITGGIAINLSADNVTIASITARAKGDGGLGGSSLFVGEGIDGVGAAGGDGGTGTGGAITLESSRGVNRILSRIKFSANGEGGAGGFSQSLAGGNGGKGAGGGILIEATGTGELITQGATLNSYGLGGAGGDGGDEDRGGNGGRGGDALGGRVELATLDQGKITLTMGEGGGDLQANAYARAGNAGSGGDGSTVGDTGGRGGNGGDATAGTFAIDIAGGTVMLGSVTGDANAQGGNAGSGGTGAGRDDDPITEDVNEFIPATPAPGGTGGDATGGTIRIDVADDGEAAGVLTAGSVTLFASGSGGFGDVSGSSSAGTVGIFEIARAASGSIRFGNLNVEAFGDNETHGTGFELETDTGRIDVDNSVNIDVSNDVRLTGSGDGTIVAGFAFDVDAGGSIFLNQDPGATVPLVQALFVDLDAGGSIDGASAGILGEDSIEASGFNVSLGRLTTTNPEFGSEGSTGIRVDAFGEAFIGSADSASTIVVNAGGLTGGMLKAEDSVSITVNSEAGTTGSVDIDGAEAGEFVRIEASNDVAAGSLIAGGNVSVGTFGDVTIGTAEAGEDIRVDGGTISLASGTAGRDVLLNASGAINVGFAQAGDDFRAISSNGAVTAERVVTTGLGEDISESGYGPGDGTNIILDAQGDARLNNGLTPGAIRLTSSTGSVLSAGTLDAQRLDASAAQNIALTDVIVDDSLFLSASGGVSGRNFTSEGDIELFAGGDISLTGTAQAGGRIFADARNVTLTGAIANGTFTGGEGGSGGITIFADDQATIGTADSASFIFVRARGFTGGSLVSADQTDIRALGGEGGPGTGIDVDAINAGTFVSLVADAGVTADNVTASDGSIFVSAGNAATLGTLLASRDIDVSANGISLASGTAGRDVLLDASGAISVAFAQAGDDFQATSIGGTVAANNVVTTGLGEDLDESGYGPGDGTNIILDAQGDARLNNGLTPGAIRLTSSTGSVLSAGTLDARRLDASAAQNIALTDVVVDDSLFLSASGGVSGRNFTSAGNIELNAGSDIALIGTARAGGEIFASGRNVTLAGAVTDGTFTGGEGGSGITIFADDQASIGTADSASFILVRARGFSGGSLVSADETDIRALGGEGGTGTGIDVDAVSAGTFVTLVADAGVTADALTALNGSVSVSAAGSATLGTLLASRDIAVSAGSISLASGTAARDIVLAANGAIGVTSAQAGDDFDADSETGAFTGGTIVTTGLGEDTTETGYGPGPGDGSNILVDAAGSIRLDNGNAPDRISLTARNGRIDSAGLIETTQFDATATGDIDLTDVDVINDLSLTTTGGLIDGRRLASRGDVTLDASGNVTVQEARAGDDISIVADGTALVGAAFAPGTGADDEGDGFNINVEAAGNVSFGKAETVGNLRLVSREGGILRLGATEASLIKAGGNVLVSSAFDLNLSAVEAGADITLASKGAINTGSLNAGDDIALGAGAALSVDSAKAGDQLTANGASIRFGNVEISGALNLSTPGTLVLETAKAGSIAGTGSSVSGGMLSTAGAILLSATGGDTNVTTATAGTDIILSGNGVVLTDGTAGRDIRLSSAADTRVLGTAKAGDDFEAKAGGTFTGVTVITTGLGPDAESSGGGTVAAASNDGSNINIAATGPIALSTGDAKDAISLASSQGSIASDKELKGGGSIIGNAATTATFAAATAGQGIDVTAGGAITGQTLRAGTDLRLASGGNVTLGAATAGDDVDVTATGTTTIATATTTGQTASGSEGASVLVNSGGGVTIERIDSAGGATLQAQNGAVLVSQDLKSARAVDASGRSVTLNAQGALAVRSATASAGNVALSSAGNLQVERAGATAQVSASSGATLGLTGQVNGTQISLASRDIAIGSNAQVGTTQRTTGIQITANGAGAPVVIGGSASGSGYRLDNAEFARLASRDVTISSQGEASSIQIDALTVRGAGASNPNVTGRLSFAAGGDVEMTGRLSFDTATEANSVRVSAGRNFFADAAGAGIAVTNGSALAGSVEIDARSIVIASRTAATELNGLANIDDRNDRLGRNDSTIPDNGSFLRAGGIRLSASEKIHVQNSGINSDEPDDRAGLLAGAGGITLVTNSVTTPVEIIINGRQVNPAGGEFTGEALIDELTIVGANGGQANFAARSTVNGCLITGVNCGVIILPESPLTRAKDLIEELEQDDSVTRPPAIGFSRLIDIEGGPLLSVIDEPVTGAGNEDIYLSEDSLEPVCPDDRTDCVVEEPVTGTGNETLQSGSEAPSTQLPPVRPQDQQPDANGPVTGTGNESLQSDSPRED